jgi:uncharacterized small protein (DUF1192 family)
MSEEQCFVHNCRLSFCGCQVLPEESLEARIAKLEAENEWLKTEIADVKGPQFNKRVTAIYTNFDRQLVELKAEIERLKKANAFALGLYHGAAHYGPVEGCEVCGRLSHE